MDLETLSSSSFDTEHEPESGLPGLDEAVKAREADIDREIVDNLVGKNADRKTDWSHTMQLWAHANRAGVEFGRDKISDQEKKGLEEAIRNGFKSIQKLEDARQDKRRGDTLDEQIISSRIKVMELLSNSKKVGFEVKLDSKQEKLKGWLADDVMSTSATFDQHLRYAAHLNYLDLWDEAGRQELAARLPKDAKGEAVLVKENEDIAVSALRGARLNRLLSKEELKKAGVPSAQFSVLRNLAAHELSDPKRHTNPQAYSHLYVLYKNYLDGVASLKDTGVEPVTLVEKLEKTPENFDFARLAGNLRMIKSEEIETDFEIPALEDVGSLTSEDSEEDASSIFELVLEEERDESKDFDLALGDDSILEEEEGDGLVGSLEQDSKALEDDDEILQLDDVEVATMTADNARSEKAQVKEDKESGDWFTFDEKEPPLELLDYKAISERIALLIENLGKTNDKRKIKVSKPELDWLKGIIPTFRYMQRGEIPKRDKKELQKVIKGYLEQEPDRKVDDPQVEISPQSYELYREAKMLFRGLEVVLNKK